jgi:hypothetical protein
MQWLIRAGNRNAVGTRFFIPYSPVEWHLERLIFSGNGFYASQVIAFRKANFRQKIGHLVMSFGFVWSSLVPRYPSDGIYLLSFGRLRTNLPTLQEQSHVV